MDFLREGLLKYNLSIPPNFEFDGKWHRFGKNKKYSLSGLSVRAEGKEYAWATLYDWSGEIDKETFRSWKNIKPQLYRQVLIKQIAVQKKQEEKDFKSFYDELLETKEHPYLTKKVIVLPDSHPFPIKDHNKNLAIPMFNIETGKMQGIEYITPDGKKFRVKHSKLNLSVYPVSTDATQNVFLTEGVADAFNIHTCAKAETYATFGILNLIKTTKYMAQKNSNKFFWVIADNPTHGQLKAASNRKGESVIPEEFKKSLHDEFGAFLNVFVVFPPERGYSEKGDPNIKDFNDLYLKSPDQAQKFIDKLGETKDGLMILGRKGGDVFVYSLSSGQIEKINEYTKYHRFLSIADKKFWTLKFGNVKDKQILEGIFSSARDREYNEMKIRPGGAWLEDGRLVINQGNGNIIGKFSEDFVYIPKRFFPYREEMKTLKQETRSFLLGIEENLFKHQNYENKLDGFAIVAWSILSIVPHVLFNRFILGLYGESGTGKSYSYEKLIMPLQSSYHEYCKKINSLTTFASFKKKLRKRIFSFYLNEAERKKYSESIFNMIKESVEEQGEPSLDQDNPRGDEIRTPLTFMAALSYNYRPPWDDSDINRAFEIGFSRKPGEDNFFKSWNWVSEFNLPMIGENLLTFFLSNYENFKRHYLSVMFKKLPEHNIKGHKAQIIATLTAFYSTFDCFDVTKFPERYLKHLVKRTENEENLDESSSWIRYIGSIYAYSSTRRENISFLDVLEGLPKDIMNYGAIEYEEIKRFLRKFQSEYYIRFQRQAYPGKVFVTIPNSDKLKKSLIKIGIPDNKVGILSRKVQAMFKNNKTVRYGRITLYCMRIPFDFFVEDERIERTIYEHIKEFNKYENT